MSEQRGAWYLLTGLIIGAVLGLLYAWAVQPVEYVDTSPSSLRPDFKDQYRALIASAYLANGDLVRAKARLELLEDADIFRTLSEQAQRTLAEGDDFNEARALGLLAIALGQSAPGPAIVLTQPPKTPTLSPTASPTSPPTASPLPSFTPTQTFTPLPTTVEPQAPPATETPTLTPTPEPEGTPSATPIPRPTSTPTRTPTMTITPGGPFALVSREKLCDTKLETPLIQIEAINGFGDPLPGILVIVTWNEGEERFYTGLIPEKGPGYADFNPAPGAVYSLRLGEGGEPATGLSAAECTDASGNRYWGAWLVKFVQT